jgi:hypothetical protein
LFEDKKDENRKEKENELLCCDSEVFDRNRRSGPVGFGFY